MNGLEVPIHRKDSKQTQHRALCRCTGPRGGHCVVCNLAVVCGNVTGCEAPLSHCSHVKGHRSHSRYITKTYYDLTENVIQLKIIDTKGISVGVRYRDAA